MPLFGLAVVSQRVIPTVADPYLAWVLTGAVIATGLLCLGSYLALRRIVASAVATMSAQHDRLEALLGVARELAEAPHPHVAAESAACWAQRLCSSEASWVLTRKDTNEPFEVLSQRGERAAEWFESHCDQWTDLIDRPLDDNGALRWEAHDATTPSFVLTQLSAENDGTNAVAIARTGRPFDNSEVDALRTLAAQTGVALTNAARGDSQRNFFSHMTELVVAALDTHVQYRAGHASDVAALANRVGRAMGLDETALHDLHFAALLHDVGMLKIPLTHQRDPKFFRKHPLVGYKMLSRIRVWEKAAPIVLQHHERIDGAGYPDGLVGNDICLGARILAVCDAWDAMQNDDSHRAALSTQDALAELEANADSQFDANVVSTFQALDREGLL